MGGIEGQRSEDGKNLALVVGAQRRALGRSQLIIVEQANALAG